MQPKLISAFRTLELSPSASLAEVKQAYRSLAKKYHPDSNTAFTSEQRFYQLVAAYQLIMDYFENPQNYTLNNEINSNISNTSSRYRSKQDMEERLKRAKEQAKKQQQAEHEIITNAFKTTQKKVLKKTHVITAFCCFIFCLFLSVDYFLPEEKRVVQLQNVSNLSQSNHFGEVIAVSTYGNEIFYVDGKIITQLILDNFEVYSREAIIYQSNILSIPRRIDISTRSEQIATFGIDEPAYLLFPVFSLLLLTGCLFYLIRPKKMFNYIVLFYTSFGLSIIGLGIAFLSGVLERI